MQHQESFASHIFAPLTVSWDQFLDILVPFRHSVQSRRQRYSLIISRVQLLSAIFAVLVPLWIVVDYALVPHYWTDLAAYRLFSALIFAIIALPRNLPNNASTASSLLIMMLMIPPAVYLFTLPIMQHIPREGLPGVLRELYSYLPYIVMGGLSIFPLTIVETILLSIPVFVTMSIGNALLLDENWQAQASTMWLLFVIMCISVFSATSQLQYMIALVKRAAVDPLTGAFTRRTGTETLELQYRLATIQHRPFTVVFLDLDDFKAVNDAYGHDEGDRVLIGLADHLRACLRRGDALIRWGGEEFLMLLSDTDRKGAELVISRMMQLGFGRRPDGRPVTASIGISESSSDMSSDWTDLVDLADNRMYAAKSRGKNRAVFDEDTEFCGPIDVAA